jgi:hypothetical protein
MARPQRDFGMRRDRARCLWKRALMRKRGGQAHRAKQVATLRFSRRLSSPRRREQRASSAPGA